MQKLKFDGIRRILAQKKIDSLFVTNQQNVTYLTGFSGLTPDEREGFLLITLKDAYLFTFPTYYGLYKDGGDGFITRNITPGQNLHQYLISIITEYKINSVGIEKDNMTISEYESLKRKVQTRFIPTVGMIEELRQIKDECEIGYIKKASSVTDQAFRYIKTKIIRGISEKMLALELEYFLKKNADDIAFPLIVAFGKNSAIPHYLPSGSCLLKPNNPILLDFGAVVCNYCSDMTRVLYYGNPPDKFLRVYDTVLKSQEIGLKDIRAGKIAGDADKKVKKFISSQGFEPYMHGLGHGVGIAIHEAPRLKSRSKEILQENMVVTVEPGIYLPDEYGIRIEDLVVLRKDRVEILSKSPKLLKNLII